MSSRELIGGYLRELHPVERRTLLSSLAVTLLLPAALGVAVPSLGGTLRALLVLLTYAIMPATVLAMALYKWTTSHEGVWTSLGRTLRLTDIDFADLRIGCTPWLTLAIISTNIVVFQLVDDPWIYATDSGDPFRLTGIVPLFVHADLGHLTSNMLFLWLFGASLESRIGRLRLLGAYLGLGVAADLFSAFSRELILEESSGGIGASGATSGVMGLFIVRCYFARISNNAPLFPFTPLPVGINVRVPAVALVVVYCVGDLTGARAEIHGAGDGIGYWAHLGGFYGGVAVAYFTASWRDGLHEQLLTRALAAEPEGLDHRLDTLDTLFEVDKENTEALLARARHRSRYDKTEQAAHDYERVVETLAAQGQVEAAAEIYVEYYHSYGRSVAPSHQLRLTQPLALMGELQVASLGLELVLTRADTTARQRQEALFRLARVLEQMGLPEPAMRNYERLLEKCPDHEAARRRVADLAARTAEGVRVCDAGKAHG